MATDTPIEGISSNHLDSFTDRERILEHVRHLLHSAQTGEFHLLAVKGHSGTGKTFLIEYLSKRLCPQEAWHTGILTFAQSFPDFRSILEGVEDALKGCVPRPKLLRYRKQREDYKRRFDEYSANIVVYQTIHATGASSVSNIQMHAQVDADLRRREAQLRAELTGALLELAEECAHPLCLFIDGYERLVETDPELPGWLWEAVLLNLAKRLPNRSSSSRVAGSTPAVPLSNPFQRTTNSMTSTCCVSRSTCKPGASFPRRHLRTNRWSAPSMTSR